MKKYSVYILKCKDGTLYTGITTHVERRVQEHKEGKGARYTRSRGVSKLVFTESGFTHSGALKRERAIKSMTRQKKNDMIRLQESQT